MTRATGICLGLLAAGTLFNTLAILWFHRDQLLRDFRRTQSPSSSPHEE